MLQCREQNLFGIGDNAHLWARILANVFFVRVDLDKWLSWARQSETGGGLLVQPATQDDQKIAFFLGQVLRVLVGCQHIAGVIGMIVGERILPFVRGEHGELKSFGKVDHFLPSVRILSS
jgi:hypothetical protein